MPDGVLVRTNLPAFREQMRALGVDMSKAFRAGVAAAAFVLKRQSVALAPVLRTPKRGRVAGLLQQSIYVARARDARPGFEHFVVAVKPAAYYWRFVERGHAAPTGKRMVAGKSRQNFVRAHPFFAPAFDRGSAAAFAAFAIAVQAQVNKESSKR